MGLLQAIDNDFDVAWARQRQHEALEWRAPRNQSAGRFGVGTDHA
jgi:hypothetical protein